MTNSATSSLEPLLLEKYRKIGHTPPEWAYPLAPSIPFVGNQYRRWGGILVYASAENLTHYEQDPDRLPEFVKDKRRFNRHRASCDATAGTSYFPNVHMAPFSNGSLLVAVAYYVLRRFGDTFNRPSDLLESIAAANLGEFSIKVGEGRKNKLRCLNPPNQTKPTPQLLEDFADRLLQAVLQILTSLVPGRR